MVYIRINNIFQEGGKADYKGLNLENISPGTQLYPKDKNVAFFKYDGNITVHQDINEITEEEYNTEVKKYNDYLDSIIISEKNIDLMNQEIKTMQEAIDFIIMNGGM